MTVSPSPSARTFEWVDEAVPRYESFFTVDEHRERAPEIAADHDHVEYQELGESADGETLWAVTVGEGDRSALLFGAPHLNEPIGSMTIDFLIHELATNDELRASLDYEFVCVPIADPDSVRLNEGWFDGPFTLSNYALNFFRPPPPEQVEATFPVEHEDYSFDDPIPATQALADLIDVHHPEFIYSFHNEAFGGCYYYISEPIPRIHETLGSLPGEYDVPLRLGEPKIADTDEFDDAIYRLRTFEDMYEGVRGDDDTPEDVLLGGNAYDYASQFDDEVVEFIVELPYYHDPKIQNETELDRTREDVIREGVEYRQMVVDEILEVIDPVSGHLPNTSMAKESVGAIKHFRDEYEWKAKWVASTDETDQLATVAQHVDERYLRQYHLLTYLGMLLRSIDHTAMHADRETYESLTAAKTALKDVFHERIGDMREGLDHETIPIWKLVAIQARAGLIAMDYLQTDE